MNFKKQNNANNYRAKTERVKFEILRGSPYYMSSGQHLFIRVYKFNLNFITSTPLTVICIH